MRTLAVLLIALAGCVGEADRYPATQDPVSPTPLPTTPDSDAGVTPAIQTDAGVAAATDGVAAPDSLAVPDSLASCPPVPPGKYKGTFSGQGSGVITFTVVDGKAYGKLGQTFSRGFLKVKDPKKTDFPLVDAEILCNKLVVGIGRPAGTTGGTNHRGSILATYRPGNKLFKGNWTMPFGQGTFKAYFTP
jgi:hypothetical protein